MATTGAPSATQQIAEEAVREALRRFHEPDLLALSPLARGRARDARAEHVQDLLCAAIDHALGAGARDQELRRTLEAAYLGVRRNHEQTADALCLTRPVYFLRLRRALERVVPCALEQAGLAC